MFDLSLESWNVGMWFTGVGKSLLLNNLKTFCKYKCMATAEQMQRYRSKHREKTNAYSRAYMRVWIFQKRLKSKEYDAFARCLRKMDITIFL